jgi:hypothetical protein
LFAFNWGTKIGENVEVGCYRLSGADTHELKLINVNDSWPAGLFSDEGSFKNLGIFRFFPFWATISDDFI